MFVNQYKQIWPTLRFCNKKKWNKTNRHSPFGNFAHFLRSLFVRLFWNAHIHLSVMFEIVQPIRNHQIAKNNRSRKFYHLHDATVFKHISSFDAVCICLYVLLFWAQCFFVFCNLPDESSNGFLFRGQFYVSDENVSRKRKSVRNTKAMKPKRQNKRWHLNEN